MTESRFQYIVHKKVAMQQQALRAACGMWGLTEAQALDEIARIFLTGRFSEFDRQSILDLNAERPEEARRIIIDRDYVVAGVSIGLPTAEQLERRIARRSIRRRQRQKLTKAAKELAADTAPLPALGDFFSMVKAGLFSADDIPSFARHDWVSFSAWVKYGDEFQEVKGFVMRFSDVASMFEHMRLMRGRLPRDIRPACVIEVSGRCGADWVTYTQDTGDAIKRGKIKGQCFKGSGDALHSDS